eukprot:gnl/MRDRNA2_/MRDRNA2_131707_c0_seq1.p1 gnl/MRDRNA2_/MRDRNA2_131707_c0~~gnl/MRDRNA2_/MRDRNA2_131707_c0_seq1.p1  ORF type:complete len:175 (-),score=34.78 gnl/MRDRNA2_/MRDRNA2_131707_c0_seq1:428-952(-)
MDQYPLIASQASNARPFNSAQTATHASVSTPQHPAHIQVQVEEGARGASVVLPALASLISKSASARCKNDKKLTACYFAFVLAMRLFLKSTAATNLPAILVMILEDSLSLVSFAMGLLYLHNSDGIARMLMRKRNPAEEPLDSPNSSFRPSLATQPVEPEMTRPEDVKLFLFAM